MGWGGGALNGCTSVCVCGGVGGGGAWGGERALSLRKEKGRDTNDRIFQSTVEGDEQELGQRPRSSLELRGPGKAQKYGVLKGLENPIPWRLLYSQED